MNLEIKMEPKHRLTLLLVSTAIFTGLFAAWQEIKFVGLLSLIILVSLAFCTGMFFSAYFIGYEHGKRDEHGRRQ